MNKIALSAAAFGVALSISGCKPLTFNGTLNVFKPLTVETRFTKEDPFCKITPDNCNPPQTVIEKHAFQAGDYQANIQYISRNQLNLNLNGHAPVVLQVPREVSLPEHSGEFDLTAAQIGQDYDLHGRLDTAVAESPRYRDRESCTYSEPFTWCEWVGGPGGGHQVCRTDWRTRWGYQDVEYFLRDTHKTVALDLRTPGTTDVAATFNGVNDLREKIVTYRGACW